MWRQPSGAITLALLVLTAASACSQEKTLSASEFVDEVNAEGVEVALGEKLESSDEGKELYAIELEPLEGATAPPEETGHHAHTGGSLYVYDDAGAAEDGLSACRAAADLLCYRASNVVVILAEGGIEAQRLGVAIQKLAEE